MISCSLACFVAPKLRGVAQPDRGFVERRSIKGFLAKLETDATADGDADCTTMYGQSASINIPQLERGQQPFESGPFRSFGALVHVEKSIGWDAFDIIRFAVTGCYQTRPDKVFKAPELRWFSKVATGEVRATDYGALLELVSKAKETPPTTRWRFGGDAAGERSTRKRKHWRRAMSKLDVEAVRAEVCALDYVRGTPAEEQEWRDADADARHNNVIEGLMFSPVEDALFDMLRDEAVPPHLATQIILRLHDHPDADRSLAITPVGSDW